MLRPAIVKTRITNHAIAHLATDRFRPPHQIMRMTQTRDRHEIGNFGHPFIRKESRQENVGIGQIKLLSAGPIENRAEFETAAFFGIEKSGENTGRIEARKTHEVNRGVYSDQSDRVQVTDDAVVFDWLITWPACRASAWMHTRQPMGPLGRRKEGCFDHHERFALPKSFPSPVQASKPRPTGVPVTEVGTAAMTPSKVAKASARPTESLFRNF